MMMNNRSALKWKQWYLSIEKN